MNTQAEQHLGRAEGFLARGDEFYGKAADEIIAAREADSRLTWREIGERFGKGDDWPARIVAWRTKGAAPSPFMEPGRETTDVRGTKRVLREAPIEQVAQIVEALPEERKEQLTEAVLADPDMRLHAVSVIADHKRAAQSQVTSEENARRKQTMTPEQLDGLLLMEINSAWFDVFNAAQLAARKHSDRFGRLSSDDAREVAISRVAEAQARVMAIFDAARGEDLDTVLAEILAS